MENLSAYSSTTNFYNSNDQIEKVKNNLWNAISYYSYNQNGKLIEVLRQLSDGTNTDRTQYAYDLNGYLIESIDQYWGGSQWVNDFKRPLY